MKVETKVRYLSRVDRAARILAERLDDPPTADVLARSVGVSRYHFQRIYRAATGETVLDTLTRLRALRALDMLATGVPVGEVAVAVGYDTPQAFARAFKHWTGTSPSKARAQVDDLKHRFRNPEHSIEAPARIEITSLEPVRLTVIRTRQPFGSLNSVYERLFAAVAERDMLSAVRGIYGLPENDPNSEPDGYVEHVAALALGDERLERFEQIELAAAPALCLRHTGPFENLDTTSMILYRYIVARGLALHDGPPVHHHLDDPDEVSAEHLRTDIYVRLCNKPSSMEGM